MGCYITTRELYQVTKIGGVAVASALLSIPVGINNC